MIRPDGPIAHDDAKTSGVWVDDEFFETLGIPMVTGRAFHPADLSAGPAVAIVNEVLAKHYWPGQAAVGKQIRLGTGVWVTVVGIAHLDDYMSFGNPPMDIVFLPFASPAGHQVRLLARSTGDPGMLTEPIRSIVRDLDPDQAVPDAETWQAMFGAWVKAAWLGMDTLGAMGVLGLVLALVGLYGLAAYEVSARTREIGIRMALGARVGQVVRMVLQQGIALAICGVGIGAGLNYGAVKVLEAILDQVPARARRPCPTRIAARSSASMPERINSAAQRSRSSASPCLS